MLSVASRGRVFSNSATSASRVAGLPLAGLSSSTRYRSFSSGASDGKFLIYGATGAVGSSLAEQLAGKYGGDSLHLVARNEAELKPLADRLGVNGFTVADVLAEDFADKVKSDVGEGPVRGLAYCVGSIDLKPLKAIKVDEDFQKCMALNLYGAAKAIQAAEKGLKAGKGSIVTFSTVAAARGVKNHAIIASAKGALEGLTISLAADLAPNVRVNCIAPSLSESKIAEPMMKMKEAIAKLHPMQRIGEGKDIAALAAFLLSEDAGWITGQVIGVDGGRSMVA